MSFRLLHSGFGSLHSGSKDKGAQRCYMVELSELDLILIRDLIRDLLVITETPSFSSRLVRYGEHIDILKKEIQAILNNDGPLPTPISAKDEDIVDVVEELAKIK